MKEDRTLVREVLNGDLGTFKVLIQQHERLVAHMVARIVHINEDREEVCQDVFMKVYKNLHKFNFKSKLSTWIATIAFREAVNYLKKKKTVIDIDIDELNAKELGKAIEVNTPENMLQKNDIKYFVMQGVEALPMHYRAVLTLFHMEEKNHAEISEIMDMPVGTVKNYLFRARKLLKEGLELYIGKEALL